MKDNSIELPPNPITPMLAALIDKASGAGTSEAIWKLMQEFANHAIEADRKHFAELFMDLSRYAAGMYEQDYDPQMEGVSDGYWYAAEFLLGNKDAVKELEADRKRRGEPVGYVMPTAIKQLKAGGNAIVGGVSQGGDVAVYLAPQPAEPVKSYLTVKYDDKGDCLYVVCDSNEPADAEEDDKGILYRRAISDGRLVGVTIMNFMGRHAESSTDAQRPAEPVKVPSMRDLIADDAYAATFQSVGQYRKALLARYTTTKEQP